MAGRHADAGLQCRRSDYSTPPQCRRRGCRCGGNVSAVLLNNSDPPRARRIPAGRHERPDGRVMILVQQLPTEAKREQPRGRLRTGATTSEQPQGARRQRRWRAYEWAIVVVRVRFAVRRLGRPWPGSAASACACDAGIGRTDARRRSRSRSPRLPVPAGAAAAAPVLCARDSPACHYALLQ